MKYLKCLSPECELTRKGLEHAHLIVEFNFIVPIGLTEIQREDIALKMGQFGSKCIDELSGQSFSSTVH